MRQKGTAFRLRGPVRGGSVEAVASTSKLERRFGLAAQLPERIDIREQRRQETSRMIQDDSSQQAEVTVIGRTGYVHLLA
jgi:hypothetical protein